MGVLLCAPPAAPTALAPRHPARRVGSPWEAWPVARLGGSSWGLGQQRHPRPLLCIQQPRNPVLRGLPRPWEMRLGVRAPSREHPNLRAQGSLRPPAPLDFSLETHRAPEPGTRPRESQTGPHVQARGLRQGSVALSEPPLHPKEDLVDAASGVGSGWGGRREEPTAPSPSGRALQPVFLVAAPRLRGARVSLGPSWG